jgi:hypothetical protein
MAAAVTDCRLQIADWAGALAQALKPEEVLVILHFTFCLRQRDARCLRRFSGIGRAVPADAPPRLR